MSDLRSRFGAITETPVPDLWDEIRRREDGTLPSRRLSRLPVIALACIVAIAGVGGGLVLLTGLGSGRRPIADGTAVANGPIYFRVGGGDGGSWIDSVMPDGSGRTTVLPNDPRDDVHYSRISFAPDGSRIAFANDLVDRYGIYTAQPDGTDVVRLTDGVNDSWPSFSPDGTEIAFASSRDSTDRRCTPGFPNEAGCATDIYVMDADGSNVVRLTDDPAGEYMPKWSPDGSSIAFVREDGPGSPTPTRSTIYIMNPDGSEARRISSASGGSDFWASWSPDGTRIVFAAIRNEDWGIWVVKADGTGERPILGGVFGDRSWYADNPVWSPDGALIAFVGNPTTGDYSPEDALYVMRPDGSDVRMVADAPRYGVAGDIAWRPIPIAVSASPPSTGEPATVDVNVTDDARHRRIPEHDRRRRRRRSLDLAR
jgi:Tol biopolymer transport system component